jgi:8-oxo-dGTP diphosphatase
MHIQIGESFEECAIREAKEETNLDLENMKLFHVTNNRNMDNDPLKHYITIFMKVCVCIYVYLNEIIHVYM